MDTEKNPHPYAEILRAIADGKQVQMNSVAGGWLDAAVEDVLHVISKESYLPGDFRIKPRVIIVNGVEVPEPVREPLQPGQEYWAALVNIKAAPAQAEWAGDRYDRGWLNLGLIHQTQEAAQIHVDALLKPSRRDQV